MRPRLSTEVIEDYEADMSEGRWDWSRYPLPVLFDDGTTFWLADGEQRLMACRKTSTPFRAEVRQGSLQDAIWYGATEANRGHGLRRSNETKRNAVIAVFKHPKGKEMSDRQIADAAGVSSNFVGTVRKKLDQGDQDERVDKNGRRINVARIGRGSPIKQIDKWWKQAPVEDRRAVYQRVLTLARSEFPDLAAV